MDTNLRDRLLSRWQQYFGGARLPVAFHSTD